MQTVEYFDRVQQRADLETSDEASHMTSSVLGVFGTLDLRGELKDAAAQLPQEIGPMLFAREASESFSASEFVTALGTELNVSEAEAEKAATAVLTTLREALSDGEFLGVNAVLPDDFHRFLTER